MQKFIEQKKLFENNKRFVNQAKESLHCNIFVSFHVYVSSNAKSYEFIWVY